MLLQKAREKPQIQFENCQISLYPDYMLLVQRRRSSFQEVKRKLRTMNLKYALLFPARLKIIYEQKT